MADDQKKINENVSTEVPERPMDPTQNAQDFLNDTQGLSGVTQGGLQQSSTEPEEKLEDTSFIRGGVNQDPTQISPTGLPKSAVNDDEYAKKVQEGMSSESLKSNNDVASEPSNAPSSPSENEQKATEELRTGVPDDFGDQTNTKHNTTQDVPYQQPYNQGEQDAVGGTTSDPRTDDDTLEMAHRAGFQPDETTENPQPVDAARDIDKAERDIS